MDKKQARLSLMNLAQQSATTDFTDLNILDRYFWPAWSGSRKIEDNQVYLLDDLAKMVGPKIMQSVINRLDGVADGALSVDYEGFKDALAPGPAARRIKDAYKDDSVNLSIELAALLSLAIPEDGEVRTFARVEDDKEDSKNEGNKMKVSKREITQIIREELERSSKNIAESAIVPGKTIVKGRPNLKSEFLVLNDDPDIDKIRVRVVAYKDNPNHRAIGTEFTVKQLDMDDDHPLKVNLRKMMRDKSTTVARTVTGSGKQAISTKISQTSGRQPIDDNSSAIVTVMIPRDFEPGGVLDRKEAAPGVKVVAKYVSDIVIGDARKYGLSNKMKNNQKLYFSVDVRGGTGDAKSWGVAHKPLNNKSAEAFALMLYKSFDKRLPKGILKPGLNISIMIQKTEATKTVARVEQPPPQKKNKIVTMRLNAAASKKPYDMVDFIQKKGAAAVGDGIALKMKASYGGIQVKKVTIDVVREDRGKGAPNPHLHIRVEMVDPINNFKGWGEKGSKTMKILKNKSAGPMGDIARAISDIPGKVKLTGRKANLSRK